MAGQRMSGALPMAMAVMCSSASARHTLRTSRAKRHRQRCERHTAVQLRCLLARANAIPVLTMERARVKAIAPILNSGIDGAVINARYQGA